MPRCGMNCGPLPMSKIEYVILTREALRAARMDTDWVDMPFGGLLRAWTGDVLFSVTPVGASALASAPVPSHSVGPAAQTVGRATHASGWAKHALPTGDGDFAAQIEALRQSIARQWQVEMGSHQRAGPPAHSKLMRLGLIGTPFQRRVWQGLCEIPAGQTCHYQDLARQLGSSARAVGGAVAANPLAYYVPCHRVVPKAGGLGGFRWGPDLKQAMLAAEAASGTD